MSAARCSGRAVRAMVLLREAVCAGLFGLGLLTSPTSVRADGGVVIERRTHGDLQITVFAAPVPLRAGGLDLSALVQNRQNQPRLDCAVEFALLDSAGHGAHDSHSSHAPAPSPGKASEREPGARSVHAASEKEPVPMETSAAAEHAMHGQRLSAEATREAATNRWLYHALLQAPQGDYTLHTVVRCGSQQTMLMTELPVARGAPSWIEHWWLLLMPPLGVVLFALHQVQSVRLSWRRAGD